MHKMELQVTIMEVKLKCIGRELYALYLYIFTYLKGRYIIMSNKFKTGDDDNDESRIGEVLISVGVPSDRVVVYSLVYHDPPFKIGITFDIGSDCIVLSLNKNEAKLLKHILEERIDINNKESSIEVTDIWENDYELRLYHEGPKVIFVFSDKNNDNIIPKVEALNSKMLSAIKIISGYMFD